MSRIEQLDILEAPPVAYDPVLRLRIALEARLAGCPQCGVPARRLESRGFENDEGAGAVITARFLCEASATFMVTPSARARFYAFEPCREAMRLQLDQLGREAASVASSSPASVAGGSGIPEVGSHS
jgi:hypothetical protein